MRVSSLISSVSVLLLILSVVVVDCFSPWQHIRRQTWGVHHLPRRLRRLIPRPSSVREDDEDNDGSQQFVESNSDGRFSDVLGTEQRKLEPRRPSIPPPDDLEPQPWKPFFIDEKRDTIVDEKPIVPTEPETVESVVAEETIAATPLVSEPTVPADSEIATVATIEPLLDPTTQEEISKAADLVREKFVSEVVEPLLAQPVVKNVPSDAIRGAALTAATLSLLASKSLLFSGVAGLGAAYVAISPGTMGDSLRLVGTGAWGTAEFLSQFLVSSNLGDFGKVLLTTSIETVRQLAITIEQASIAYNNATSQMAELEQLHSDVQQVLMEADEAMKAAEAAIQEGNVTQVETTPAEELESATLESAPTDQLIAETEAVSAEVKVAEEPIQEEFEDVEDMQASLSETTTEDLQEIGDIVSEEDLQQRATLFLEEVPLGMEGDDDEVAEPVVDFESVGLDATAVDDEDPVGLKVDEDIKVEAEDEIEAEAEAEIEAELEEEIEPELEEEIEAEVEEEIEPDLEEEIEAEVEEEIEAEVEEEIEPEVEAEIEAKVEVEIEAEVEEDMEAEVEDEVEEEIEDEEFESDDEFDDDDDFPEGFEAFSEEDMQELFLDGDLEENPPMFSDEVPEGIEADDKEDIFVLDEEPEFVVGDLESGLEAQESTTEFGDLAPEGVGQEDVEFDVLDEDPDLGLVVADDDTSDQEEPVLTGDFKSKEVEEESVLISDDDWDASIRLAQKGLEGTIVGIDEAVADMNEKANWEAAKRLAQALTQPDEEKEKEKVEVEEEEEEVDLEALGRAAREAVQQFEEQKRKEQDEIRLERKKWESEMVTLSSTAEENDLDALTEDEKDLEEIAKAARAAVEMFEAQRAGIDDSDFDVDQEPVSQGSSKQKKSVKSKKGRIEAAAKVVSAEDESELDESEEDLEEIARAARAAVELFEAQQREEGEFDFDGGSDDDIFQPAPTLIEPGVRDWSTLSFTQLKDELKARGLSTKGKKSDLVSTLAEYEASLISEEADLISEEADFQLDGDEPDIDASVLESFSDDEFLSVATPDAATRDWSALSAAQLKDELKARGLSTKGKKADLVLTLVEYEASLYGEDDDAALEATGTQSIWDVDEQSDEAKGVFESAVNGAFGGNSALFESFLDTLGPDQSGRDWAALTTAELKEELKALGLSVKGKKSELVDRLIEFEERSELEAIGASLESDVIGASDDSILPEEPSDEALMEIEIEESTLLSGDISDNYDSMPVAQLKEELRKRGLRVGGKKDELIERLRSSEGL